MPESSQFKVEDSSAMGDASPIVANDFRYFLSGLCIDVKIFLFKGIVICGYYCLQVAPLANSSAKAFRFPDSAVFEKLVPLWLPVSKTKSLTGLPTTVCLCWIYLLCLVFFNIICFSSSVLGSGS